MLSTVWLPAHAQGEADSVAVAMTAGPGQMAEAAIAVDPANPRHLAAAADPYAGTVRVLLTTSEDGGTTWSPPTVVLPQGFAKSYDPVVRFGGNGSVIVAAGASGVGERNCQPASAIFVAVLNGGTPAYRLVRDARLDGAYVDRPGLALTAENRAYVTWTESSGPGAACRATPVRSTVMIAVGEASASFDNPITLPSSGLPAPFGATPAVRADGTVVVATGEHTPGQRSRVTLTTSTDGGRTFSVPDVVFDGAPAPAGIAGVHGFVFAVPSLALGPEGQTSVAFVQAAPGGNVGSVVVERAGTAGWQTISPATEPGTAELLPQVLYDRDGNLWLLSARVSNGYVDLALHRHRGDWEAAINLARGPSDRYVELGEALGFVSAGDVLVAAAPIDRLGDSALLVSTHRLVALLPSQPTSTSGLSSPTSRQYALPSPAGHRTPATMALVAAAVAGLCFQLSRRSRSRHRATP